MTDTEPARLEPGGRLGDLLIEERIGEGAFATVYRARDPLLQRYVALKVLDPRRLSHREEARRQVLREARIVARLSGPHVVTLYRIHQPSHELWVFEMEYMAGGDLSRRLRRDRTLPHDEVIRIGRALLSALGDAHANEIVHQDVKPANVLLTEAGVVKLSDFGLGRLTHEGNLADSVTRGPRGTPKFMAPEVVMGQAATPRSDLWSLGVLLYQLVAGRLPFPGRSIERLFNEILNEPPQPLAPEVPTPLVEAIFACLMKAPEERPVDAASVLQLLAHDAELRVRAPLPARAPTAPPAALVGRLDERERVERLLDDGQAGRGGFLFLQGEAGIGKTAFLHALVERALGAGFRTLQVHMRVLEGLRRPLLQALREVATGAAETTGQPTGSGQPYSSDVHRSLLMLGGRGDARQAVDVEWVFERALQDLAEDRPTLLVIEDAHTGDREDLRLLQTLATRLSTPPLLFAVSYRTRDPTSSETRGDAEAGLHDLRALPGAVVLDLPPLDREGTKALLESRFDLKQVPAEVLDRVQAMSEGVPLYALELFRHLLDQGEIERTGDRLSLLPRWGRSDLPHHIREMVQRRMTGLTEGERELLEVAAVLGVEFDGRGLAAMLDEKLVPLLRVLQRLYRDRALLRPTESGFRFDHGLFRDVLYGDLAPELRRALHAQWAEHLESRGGDVDPEVLGWHWERAERRDKAREPLLAACRAAMRRLEATRAWDLATRAGVLDEGVDDDTLREHLRTLLRLSPAYNTPEEADRVEALYQRLQAAATRLGDEEMARCVFIESSYNRFYRAGPEAVDPAAIEVAARDVRSPEARGDALRLLGTLARHDGRLGVARELFGRADTSYEGGNVRASRAAVLASMASLDRVAGAFARAQDLYDRAASIFAELGSLSRAAINQLMGLQARAHAGELDGTAEAMSAPLAALERVGQAARAAHVRALQGELLAVQGRREEAWGRYERARAVLEGGALGDALLALRLVETRFYIEAGELGRAKRGLERIHDQVGPEGASARTDVVLLEAYGLVARGDLDEAGVLVRGRLRADDVETVPLYLARTLQELARLAFLGVEAGELRDRLGGEVPPREGEAPCVRVARTLFRACSLTDASPEGIAAWRAAERVTGEVPAAYFPLETKLLGALLGARAERAEGRSEAAEAQFREGAEQARRLGLIWHELCALAARESTDGATAARVREIEARLGAENPGDPELVTRLRSRGVIPAVP